MLVSFALVSNQSHLTKKGNHTTVEAATSTACRMTPQKPPMAREVRNLVAASLLH
jgi:hypothetical protein